MTNKIQKIREEVEIAVNRRLNLLNGDYFDLNEESDGFTNELMDIIDSLQEEPDLNWKEMSLQEKKDLIASLQKDVEKPVNEDLEEAVKNRDEYKEWQGSPDIQKELIDFAKFGNQYKEPMSEDLEEAAKSYSNNLDNICGSIGKQTRNAFKAGAQWQKEQMMTKAVDAKITLLDGISYVSKDVLSQFKQGDKVKVIVIKED